MPVYSAWPDAAYYPYHEIKSRQAAICEMASLCLTEGRRFKEVIEALVPIIRDQADEIRAYTDQITEMLPASRLGRFPKWYRIAGQVEKTALNIRQLVIEDVAPALKVNQMIVVRAGLEEIGRQAQKIERTLRQIPEPMKPTDLEVWEDTIEEAVRKLDR